MIIFFDWDSPDGASGPQDGLSDHTGIVEKVENGIVYTVEGNSGDSCRINQYPVSYYEILGYGVPNIKKDAAQLGWHLVHIWLFSQAFRYSNEVI